MSKRFVGGTLLLVFSVLWLSICAIAEVSRAKTHRLLYFTLAAGYRHESIDLSKRIVKELGYKPGAFEVTTSDDPGQFTNNNLKNYDAVMFYTFGEIPMTPEQKQALIKFVRSGHGFVGIHSTIKTLQEWSIFGEMLGGRFAGKSLQQNLIIDVTDPSNEIVSFLHGPLEVKDEVYDVSLEPNADVLLRLHSGLSGAPAAGSDVGNWPIAWTRPYGQGRVYVTSLGHESAVWEDAKFQQMLLNGIKWAMGESKQPR